MVLDFHLLGGFFLYTLGETLTPGPTLGLVLVASLAKDKKPAFAVVSGIALANALWVTMAFLISRFGLPGVGEYMAVPFNAISAGFLTFLAASRLLRSTVILFAGLKDEEPKWKDGMPSIYIGFAAHFINPLSIGFYGVPFVDWISRTSPQNGFLMGLIAIALDLFVYGAIVFFGFSRLGGILRYPVFRLLAGLSLLFLIWITFRPSASSAVLICMLSAFFVGAMAVGMGFVSGRKGRNNGILWKVVKLWGALFGAYGVFGAIIFLIVRTDPDSPGIPGRVVFDLKSCLIVSAALAAVLGSTAILGEIQEQLNPASDDSDAAGIDACWHSNPYYAAMGSFGFLLGAFLFLLSADFGLNP